MWAQEVADCQSCAHMDGQHLFYVYSRSPKRPGIDFYGPVTVSVAVLVTVPYVAVSTGDWVDATACVVTVNVFTTAPAGTVTVDDGSVMTVESLLEILITSPPAGAAAVSWTRPVVETPPATDVGEKDVSRSVGGLTVNVVVAEPPPGAGFDTVTVTTPAVVMSAAGIVMVSNVAVCADGVTAKLPNITVVPDVKPEPLILNVKAGPPAVPLAGRLLVMAGAG